MRRKPNIKFEKENRQNPFIIQSRLFIFFETRLFTENFSRTTTIHPGISGGLALWADKGPPRMNTVASRDQFKPIGIGGNLVVNYNCCNHKNYNFLACNWFNNVLFSTYSLAKLLSDSLLLDSLLSDSLMSQSHSKM